MTNLRKYGGQMILPIIKRWELTRKDRKFPFHEVLQNMMGATVPLDDNTQFSLEIIHKIDVSRSCK